MEEWVEVRGPSIEQAVQAAVEELGLASPDEADIQVLEQPERGFLGFGSRDAVVRVSKKRSSGRKRRRRGKGGRGAAGGRSDEGKKDDGGKESARKERRKGNGGKGEAGSGGAGDEKTGKKATGGPRAGDRPGGRKTQRKKGTSPARKSADEGVRAPRAKATGAGDRAAGPKEEAAEMPDLNEQAQVIEDFLTGLLDAFGLEGSVAIRVEDEVIFADITGDQTEALIGSKGTILQSIRELARTVVQRKTQAGARIRLDIGGYMERRREALGIYARRLAEQVLAEGGEVMLEPMNPADRKVVHDAIAEVEGVRSYSEGEEPNRSVVVSPVLEE